MRTRFTKKHTRERESEKKSLRICVIFHFFFKTQSHIHISDVIRVQLLTHLMKYLITFLFLVNNNTTHSLNFSLLLFTFVHTWQPWNFNIFYFIHSQKLSNFFLFYFTFDCLFLLNREEICIQIHSLETEENCNAAKFFYNSIHMHHKVFAAI